jgi:pimeloyl-ACP methyl ester carboxylesterase
MSTLPNIGQVRTTQIDGLDIRLARSGATEGVPILLTSPWPESIYAFRDTLPAIKSLGPIICVDLPGFGRSESRPDVMAPEAMGGFVSSENIAAAMGQEILWARRRDSFSIVASINGH